VEGSSLMRDKEVILKQIAKKKEDLGIRNSFETMMLEIQTELLLDIRDLLENNIQENTEQETPQKQKGRPKK
jgi:hypothetical protein